ncbi:MAG TPA: hypothetical protein VNJ04_07645, partial [Gemmatimonadaceae bacterium]|nr:hypothetical protein [Gemmatimonadaceae bacterium]
MIAGVVGGITIVAWWLFFSRAPWPERVGAIVLMVVAIIATRLLVHRSVATGMMGLMLPIYALPLTLGPAFVAWAVCTRGLSGGLRHGTMAATILLACGMWTLVRTNGLFAGAADLAWRWSPTAEEKLLAQAS